MKRRRFLSLMGAAATAPLVPARAFAAKAVPLSSVAVQAAIRHAQSRAVFSVWGLAKAVNISPDQAVAVMEHLAARGVLGPLQGTTHGGRWASSRIMQSNTMAKARAARLARDLQDRAAYAPRKGAFDIDLTKLTARLRSIHARYECLQPVAGVQTT